MQLNRPNSLNWGNLSRESLHAEHFTFLGTCNDSNGWAGYYLEATQFRVVDRIPSHRTFLSMTRRLKRLIGGAAVYARQRQLTCCSSLSLDSLPLDSIDISPDGESRNLVDNNILCIFSLESQCIHSSL